MKVVENFYKHISISKLPNEA